MLAEGVFLDIDGMVDVFDFDLGKRNGLAVGQHHGAEHSARPVCIRLAEWLDLNRQPLWFCPVAVYGGELLEGDGFYVQPTILADIDHSMAVAKEEVFGPVLGVMPFDDEDAVIALANDNRYGLAASLWTNDLSKAMNLVPRIEAGTVWVNAHVLLDPAMPFGGVKQSGMGREFGRAVIEAYTELKSVCIAH